MPSPLTNGIRQFMTKNTHTKKKNDQRKKRCFGVIFFYFFLPDESMYMAERARALRPRLRRLNSMDDMMPTPLSTPNNPPQRVTSAPDLSQSHNGRQSFAANLVGYKKRSFGVS